MTQKYDLVFNVLKHLAKYQGSDATLHRYRQLGLVKSKKIKKDSRNEYRYNLESVSQVKLIPKLKRYNFDLEEIRQIFKKVPLKEIQRNIINLSPTKFDEFVKKYGVVLT